jgi:hypothetical protein
MTRTRILALAALAVGLAAATARGQSVDLKSYRMEGKPLDGPGLTRLQDMKTGKLRPRGPQEAANKALLKQAAENYVYRVTQDQYYVGGDTGELKPKTGLDQSLDEVFRDVEIYVLVPKPGERLSLDQVHYIEDFGAAIDQAVVAVLTSKGLPPPVIRVNAARMLAASARSGSPAHAKTVTALLTNQFFKDKDGKPIETPPDVLLWAMKAAEYLLAAPDPTAIGTANPARHTLKEPDLVPLVQALDNLVLNNPPVAGRAAPWKPELAVKPPPPPPTAGGAPGEAQQPPPQTEPQPQPQGGRLDPRSYTPEQTALVQYFRRQAIRALAQVRFDAVGGNEAPEVRPGFTLAKVAVNDMSINPPPTVAEVGEAALGLCDMHPSADLNVDALLHAAAYGTYLFFGPKVGDPQNRLIPWRIYAARVTAAYGQLQKNAQMNPRLSPFRQQINALAEIVTNDLAGPVERGDQTTPPRLERITQWLQTNAPAKPGLYGDGQQYRLNPRPLR